METIRIKRANVILDVSPDEKDRYMDRGYSVIDAKTGKVIEQAMPTDIPSLQNMVAQLQKEVKEKDKKIKELTSKPKAPKKASATD